VTPRVRVTMLVAASAALAAVITVGAVALQSGDGEAAAETTERPDGAPPLALELGVRNDVEAVALRRAERLYGDDRREEAAAIFSRYDSLDARVGAALAAWPDGSVRALQELVREQPQRALVHLNLGYALFWDGRREEALEQWRAAKRVEPDSPSAVRADDLLHPNVATGLPNFVATAEPPPEIAALPADRQLERLRTAAAGGSLEAKLLYGIALQRLGRPLSARGVFDEAVRAAPTNVQARVAAAVARFDKEHPEAAFSRLGPLAQRHPRDPSVRFHLGLLLLWIGEVEEAERQLRLVDPETPLGKEAKRLLDRLEKIGRK
jgi:tetratricopeptide (TPR) repeat protein